LVLRPEPHQVHANLEPRTQNLEPTNPENFENPENLENLENLENRENPLYRFFPAPPKSGLVKVCSGARFRAGPSGLAPYHAE
jgi:hypothetical protein